MERKQLWCVVTSLAASFVIMTLLLFFLGSHSSCPNNCDNHGICAHDNIEPGEIFFCLCDGGWSGSDCSMLSPLFQAPRTPVASKPPLFSGNKTNCANPCNNNGTCVPPDKSHPAWWCNCTNGWNGTSCGEHSIFSSSSC